MGSNTVIECSLSICTSLFLEWPSLFSVELKLTDVVRLVIFLVGQITEVDIGMSTLLLHDSIGTIPCAMDLATPHDICNRLSSVCFLFDFSSD